MMNRLPIVAVAVALFAAGCGSSSTTSPSSPSKPTFTADLRPSNETTPVTNAEASGTGNATITFDVTRDAAGNILTSSATFVVNMSGFPAGTGITGAHIHPGAAGTSGSVLVSTALASGEVVLASGSGSFTKVINIVDAANTQNIINNPAAFYFNIHTATNPGGVARGQLVKVQ
jgi:hypothetical protein